MCSSGVTRRFSPLFGAGQEVKHVHLVYFESGRRNCFFFFVEFVEISDDAPNSLLLVPARAFLRLRNLCGFLIECTTCVTVFHQGFVFFFIGKLDLDGQIKLADRDTRTLSTFQVDKKRKL